MVGSSNVQCLEYEGLWMVYALLFELFVFQTFGSWHCPSLLGSKYVRATDLQDICGVTVFLGHLG